MKKWKEVKKENKLGLVALIVSILIFITSVTYAIWFQSFKGEKEQIIKTGTLILEIADEENEISLTNSIPVSDSEGIKSTPYTFTIKNTGSSNANFRISLVDDDKTYSEDGCSNNRLDWSMIKYYFSYKDDAPLMNLLNKKNGVLYEGVINSNEVSSCTLRLWIKSDAENGIMGNHFHGKIKIEAIQSDQELDS